MDYDFDYNEAKITSFQSQPATYFFFNQPMRKYLPQVNISEKDLAIYLKLTNANKQFMRDTRSAYMQNM